MASCSPLLHEADLPQAPARTAGINPFFFQMVNIREHDSWVHTTTWRWRTDKAKALVRGGGASGWRFHKPLEPKRVADQPGRPGGGRRDRRHPRGADPGQRRQAGLPGRARADHRRPHGQVRQDLPHPRLRRLHPHAQDVRRCSNHPNITLWTLSEVDEVDGYVGNFTVTVQPQAALHHRGRLCRLPGVHRRLRVQEGQDPRRVQPGPVASASRSTSRSRRPSRRWW